MNPSDPDARIQADGECRNGVTFRRITPLSGLLGQSPGIVAVREKVERLIARQADARRLSPILLEGETGTGKGLLAREIHRAGPRRDGPFVDINCAAIPETLLEAELFGFERGAFTDARQGKPGLFHAAHHGTIFLDEIGLLPEALQAKLLKVIEERGVRRLGSTRSEPVDVWIVTATNEELAVAMRARHFREDLYHRLAVLTLRLPPVRERGADILLLAEHFLECACGDYDMPRKTLTPDARAALLAYRWPGNVRELSNVIERVVLLSDAPVVTAEMLALPVDAPAPPFQPARSELAWEDGPASGEDGRLLEALRRTSWNVSRAAAWLGISRNALRYRMEKYRLRPEGSPLSGRAERPVAPRPLAAAPPPLGHTDDRAPRDIRWERRRVALLRAVLVSSPRNPASIDPSKQLEVLVEKVESFGGRIEEVNPSGILGAFGLEPVLDAPRRAVLAAMAIQKAAEREARLGDGGFAVKVAVHIVHVPVGRVGGVLAIHSDARRKAWSVLETLVAGEPGRILIETAGCAWRRDQAAPNAAAESPSALVS